MGTLVAIFFALLGLCVGSFLNVVILRFGYTERNNPRSRCASCSMALRAFDLVPVLSYVVLRGRCRHCGSSIHVQYPLVELATALLFVLNYLVLAPSSFATTIEFLAFWGFWSALLALVVYDIRHTLIPLPFVYAVIVCAVIETGYRMSVFGTGIIFDSLLGALVTGGFFALVHVLTRGRGMGIGDAYVAGSIGLMFGFGDGVAAALIGVWCGALVGILTLAITHFFPQSALWLHGQRVTLSTELPFAPFLALGAVAVFVWPLLPVLVGFSGLSL